ncbi:DUF6884 domain-containing protein [Embleya sp. NPDC059237]|uniref:DUF6884 domain-containing protein n=1 Tax=Embleya sp. NPDC059237 TaxID=3346784 RepID=UPI00368E12C9
MSPGTAPRPIAPEHALVVAGCSRRKHPSESHVPALELYAGGIAPQLRARLGALPPYRARIRFLSAEHGLVHADTPLLPYDRHMTARRRTELERVVGEQVRREWEPSGPATVLVVADAAYLPLLCAVPSGIRVRWIPDPHGWAQAAAVLDSWRWP